MSADVAADLTQALTRVAEHHRDLGSTPQAVAAEQAAVAQRLLCEHINGYAAAVITVCLRRHIGGTPADGPLPAKPCPRCAQKVKHLHSAAALIAPDPTSVP